MKVLLTGQLPPSVRYIGARLIRDGHRVSALGRVPDAQALQSAGIAVRAHADLRRLMEAARFGAVVFFAALRCDDPAEGGSPPGSLLDELSAVVRAAMSDALCAPYAPRRLPAAVRASHAPGARGVLDRGVARMVVRNVRAYVPPAVKRSVWWRAATWRERSRAAPSGTRLAMLPAPARDPKR